MAEAQAWLEAQETDGFFTPRECRQSDSATSTTSSNYQSVGEEIKPEVEETDQNQNNSGSGPPTQIRGESSSYLPGYPIQNRPFNATSECATSKYEHPQRNNSRSPNKRSVLTRNPRPSLAREKQTLKPKYDVDEGTTIDEPVVLLSYRTGLFEFPSDERLSQQDQHRLEDNAVLPKIRDSNSAKTPSFHCNASSLENVIERVPGRLQWTSPKRALLNGSVPRASNGAADTLFARTNSAVNSSNALESSRLNCSKNANTNEESYTETGASHSDYIPKSRAALYDETDMPAIIITESELNTGSINSAEEEVTDIVDSLHPSSPKVKVTTQDLCSVRKKRPMVLPQGPLTGRLGDTDSDCSVDALAQEHDKTNPVESTYRFNKQILLSVSASLENEITAAAQPFQSIDRPSIQLEIEDALRHERVKIKDHVEIIKDAINAKLANAEANENNQKSILKSSPPAKRPLYSVLRGFVKISPSNTVEGVNLSELTDDEIAVMFKNLGESSRKRVHWISYQPPPAKQKNKQTNGTIKLQLNPNEYMNRSFHEPETGFTYTVFEQKSIGKSSPALDLNSGKVEKPGNKITSSARKSHIQKRLNSVDVLGWKDRGDFQFIHLEQRRPAFLFVSTDIPREADGIHLVLTRFVDDVHCFKTNCIHSGTNTMHFALVNQSLRFKGEPRWQYATQTLGLLDEYTSQGIIIQFKEEHQCPLRRYRPKQDKSRGARSSSSNESVTPSSCSESCAAGTAVKAKPPLDVRPRMPRSHELQNVPKKLNRRTSTNTKGGEKVECTANVPAGKTCVYAHNRRRHPSLKVQIPRHRGTSTPIDDYTFETASDYIELIQEELVQLDSEQAKVAEKIDDVERSRKRPKSDLDFGVHLALGVLVAGVLILFGRRLITFLNK